VSDAAHAEAQATIRKDRLHSTMLIELLVLMIFLALAYAFVTRDDFNVTSLQQKLEAITLRLKETQLELARTQRENIRLKRENALLQDSLNRWMQLPKDRLPANQQPVVMPKEEYERLKNKEAMIDERQKENADLRAQLAQARGGGVDLPNCTVTASFLLSIDLRADGRLSAHPVWAAGAASAAQAVPGISDLASGRALSPAEFSRLAERVQAWGRSQPTPCGFRVQVQEQHRSLDLYKRQVKLVERFFYVRRN
jgi:hypothetical protein